MTPVTVIVGTGRVGLSLARALSHSGGAVRLLARFPRALPADLPVPETEWAPALASAALVVLAVPDDAVAATAAAVAVVGTLRPGTVVLHCSGLHDAGVLEPLHQLGAVTGSWHPLQSFPSVNEATPLTAIPAILEGDPLAVAAARAMSEQLGMHPILELSAAGKVRYHAAAVFASNYLVVLAEIAERLAREAGAGDASASLFHPIMQQTLENMQGRSPASALTGPVRRGDVGTVAAHLAVLNAEDRASYVALAREALRLAESVDLSADQAAALHQILG